MEYSSFDWPDLHDLFLLEDKYPNMKAAYTKITETFKDPALEQSEIDRLKVANAELVREVLASKEDLEEQGEDTKVE